MILRVVARLAAYNHGNQYNCSNESNHSNQGSLRIPNPIVSAGRTACRSSYKAPVIGVILFVQIGTYRNILIKLHSIKFIENPYSFLELFHAYGRKDGAVLRLTLQDCQLA
jgi:hypothetical protein